MSDSDSSSPAQAWRPRHNPWIIAVAVMSATFMEVLDTSIANVSLPHIAGNLAVTPEESTWVLTSYIVANAIILPMTGWLGNRLGRKRLLMACIVIFTLASVLCGLAGSLGWLIAARILQGAGGGAMVPLSQAVLLESFPPRKRGMAMAVFAMGVVVAPILGPTLGGWITDNYSWRWIFYINLPVGVAALLMSQAFIEDPPYIRADRGAPVDLLGFCLLAIWLATMQIVLDKGEQEAWFESDWICAFTVISVVAFLGMILREFTAAYPIVDLRALKNRNFSVGLILITLIGIVLYGTTAALPLFLQTSLGYPALQSGLVMSPRGVGAFCSTLLVGRLMGKVPNRVLIVIGFLLLSAASYWLAGINTQISPSRIIGPSVLNGIAVSLIFVPLTTSTMGTIAQAKMGNATGLYNLMRNLGGSIGIAAVTTLLSREAQVRQVSLAAHLTASDTVFTERLAGLTTALTSQSGNEASGQAAQMIYNQMNQQAHLFSFVFNFRLFGALCLCCIPLALLFKHVRRGAGPAGAH